MAIELFDVRPSEWQEFIAKDKTALLLGFLACESCKSFRAAVEAVDPALVAGWTLGYCSIPANRARELTDRGVFRSFPVFIAHRDVEFSGQIAGVRYEGDALTAEVERLLTAAQ